MRNHYFLSPFYRTAFIFVLLIFIFLFGGFPAPVVEADAPEEICPPPLIPSLSLPVTTVNAPCTEAALRTALSVGGYINFNCGGDVTITVDSQLELNSDVSTVLDGAGKITLDGQDKTRILYKGWHDPKLSPITVIVKDMKFINGKAPAETGTGGHSGGAINVGHPGTRLHVINSTFENNSTTSVTVADNQGGAIYVHNSYETVISGSTFRNNRAGNGGAFGGIATGLIVYNSHFIGNGAVDDSSGGVVKGHGGAIHLDGVTNGYNANSNKVVDVCGSLFQGNTAVRGGGAIKVTVSDNKGTKATYQRSSFINNRLVSVPPTEGHGGAIYHIEDDYSGGTSEDNIEIRDSTFANNYAYKQGGAAWILVRGTGSIVNSTFSENEASQPGTGRVGQGGALVISKGIIDIINSTFAENFATFQGGAIFAGGVDPDRVVTLKNALFYENYLEPIKDKTEWQGYHTNRPLQNGGNNLQYPREKEPDFNNEVNNLITSPASAINFENPLLGPLADNQGPTQTRALQTGSPAIEAGTDSGCPGTDQRDLPRVGQCDIGAYEYVNQVVVTPQMQAIDPGGTATYQLKVVSGTGATGSFSLTKTNPDAAHLTIDLSLASVTPGKIVTMTLTDNRSGSLKPGQFYTIALQANDGSTDLSGAAGLLVGGERLYLPLVLKN